MWQKLPSLGNGECDKQTEQAGGRKCEQGFGLPSKSSVEKQTQRGIRDTRTYTLD